MCKKLVIGVGTGRCGTVSLQKLLNAQEDSYVEHESRPLLPWIVDDGLLQMRIAGFDARPESGLVGEVGFFWLPYLTTLLRETIGTKVIALIRDKEETVDSYMHKTQGRNHWMRHDGSYWKLDPVWDDCYPKYPKIITPSKQAAIEIYYDEYYDKVLHLIGRHPGHIQLYGMDKLNTKEGQDEIFSFLGIKGKYLLPCRYNQGVR
jgi:hypothetical protein